MPEVLFQELADDAPIMIWRAGPDKLCNWFNHQWLEFAGRDLADERGFGWTERIHPDDRDKTMSHYSDAFDARRKFNMTYRLRRHDGAYHWLLENGAPYFKNAQFAGYFGTCVDITEQREAHELTVKALAERDALLREVYHRVKNNLQQIVGLIAIEGALITDPQAHRVLSALEGRVRAMGAVHQRLIAAANLVELSVREFLAGLCRDIARSAGADRRGITVQVDVGDGSVDIDRAIILGLLVNEIMTNAFKHAFPDGRAGTVSVVYRETAETIVLEVADNGVGLPEGAEGERRGTGQHLIAGFADQLNGRLEIERTAGTRVRVFIAR
jgi:PAS domain S-box-containing protein